MRIYKSTPTPGQEFTGRAVLAALGIAAAVGGIWLGRNALGLASGDSGADTGRFVALMFAVAAFLFLVGVTFAVLAFLPSRDTRRGPPRGFQTISAAFDIFWRIVGGLFR